MGLGLGHAGVLQLLQAGQASRACWGLVPAGRLAAQLSHSTHGSLGTTTTAGGGGGGGKVGSTEGAPG